MLFTAACSKHQEKTYANVLVKGNMAEPPTLDAQKIQAVNSANIAADLYEGLTAQGPNGMVPGLAKSWKISADGLTYTFYLRKGLKWSNGQPLTSKDVAYGLRRLVDPKTAAPSVYLVYPIKNAQAINKGKKPLSSLGVSTPNDHEVVLHLGQRTPYLLGLLSNSATAPTYAPGVEKWGNQFTQVGHFVSNGAYKLKDWVVNGHITLVRNPYYWDAKNVHIAKVKYLPISDQTTV